MSYSIERNIRTYETAYGTGFPTHIFFQTQFGVFPSLYETEIKHNITIISLFNDGKYDLVAKNTYTARSREGANVDDVIYVDKKNQVLIVVQFRSQNNERYVILQFLYNAQTHPIIGELIDFKEIKKFEKVIPKSNINLVSSDKGYLDTREYNIEIPDVSLSLNYGDDFLKVHNKILTKLNSLNEKGIVLLHGIPGSGKSTYIKHITKLITKKEVMFIPPSMASLLSEPTIIPFLMDRPNSVLIIEDSEKIIAKRESVGSSDGVSNLLNLTDGILGDCLKIQVIATFNMEKKLIDDALLRKGRLIAEHQFNKLSVDQTNKLLKHLKKEYKSDVGLTLADIYNIDEEEIRVTNGVKKIGFKQ